MPDAAFLFPAFNDRSTDLHSTLYYSKDAEELKEDFVDLMLGCPLPLSAGGQKEIFQALVELPEIEHLIAADKLSSFLTEYKKLKAEKEACNPVKDILKRIEIIQAMDKLIQASVNTIGKEIYSNLPSCYKRGACPVVKCNLPEFQLADMISVHDLKDYGDCDEEIYRQLFLDGCYRLEINIPGENGILSKKIYYLKPEPPKNSIELIPISYQDFLKWKL